MLTSPLLVIDETLENLQVLSEFLFDETDERVISHADLTKERRLCKEALQTIRVLIPKLEAVRASGVSAAAHPSLSRCPNCDD